MDNKPSKLFGQQLAKGVCVELRIEDAMALRPGWTETDAADFLRVCSTHLAAAMLNTGVMELAWLIRTGEELIARGGTDHAE